MAEQKAALKNRTRHALGMQAAKQFQLLRQSSRSTSIERLSGPGRHAPILAESKELAGINKSSG
ncbi:MAG: hypothetical protein QHD01_14870 [Bradyrhizobium sp.]|uniref:hypothetical protein n=1 Tax=Bradyrhizobium sp. TaxID=376 RepID=UPI0029AC043F|nr:hypothetical protein [Bradyrhizobium sp.]MDX3967872.1 hypothetical protein [Bradyrhizobium sp.]